MTPHRPALCGRTWRFARHRLRAALTRARIAWYWRALALPETTVAEFTSREAAARTPPIMEDICLPPYHGPTDHDDYSPLAAIALTVAPHVAVEIGTAHGNLTANLCALCQDVLVYTVNAPAELQSGHNVTYYLDADAIGRVYRHHGFAPRVRQILCNSLDLELGSHLRSQAVDLAIIDGCHDVEFVLSDFQKIEPHLRPGGVVLLHDTAPTLAGHLAESYLACMLLRRRGFDVRYLVGTWWAVWRKPRGVSPP